MRQSMNLLAKTVHAIEDMRMTLAAFPEARVVSVLDDATCDYCRTVHGRLIRDLVKSGDHYFPPFHEADASDPRSKVCRCVINANPKSHVATFKGGPLHGIVRELYGQPQPYRATQFAGVSQEEHLRGELPSMPVQREVVEYIPTDQLENAAVVYVLKI
jgi:hypothetical protein